jgi:hypothetical protein
MARNNTGNRNRGRNNNPEGKNQYSSGWLDSARERPIAAAATAAAAVGAGVFLWSRRSTLSDQISNLSEQIIDWKDSMASSSSDEDSEYEMAEAGEISGAATGATSSRTSRSAGSRPTATRSNKGSNRGMSETGGGNASLGAHSGTTGTGSNS